MPATMTRHGDTAPERMRWALAIAHHISPAAALTA